MKSSRTAAAAGFVALLLLLASDAGAETKAVPLFLIERSKNANVVRYDARLTAEGALEQADPVVAYWVMLAGDGHREDLNWVERTKAYGFTVKREPGAACLKLTLVAYRDRAVEVCPREGGARATLVVDGRPCLLQKLFIDSREGLLFPTVNFVELTGADLETGEIRHEKILPK